ncbi:hypothetical protein BC938DRAFT_477562, partial [Jimgerdemannia flammicorona]
ISAQLSRASGEFGVYASIIILKFHHNYSHIQFESYLLTHVTLSLKSDLQLNTSLMSDTRIMGNIAKYAQLAVDAVFQGWYLNGTEQIHDFLAAILETLQSFESVGIKGASDQSLSTLYRAFNRIIMLKFSDLEQGDMNANNIITLLNKCIYHQKIILSVYNTDNEFLRCLCYHLYKFMLFADESVRATAMNVC